MNTSHLTSLATLSSLAAKDARLKRKKVLEEVAKRRKLLYQRFREKMKQSQLSSEAA